MNNRFIEGQFDAVVIGAGHAGCEAALALARTGFNTAMLTLNLDSIAFLACNPSIGGTAKGQIVREIDALGGQMGIVADKALLQIRMLNRGKGAAVQSLRSQADKNLYHTLMKKVMENTENLKIVQGEAVDIIVEDGKVAGVKVVTENGEYTIDRTRSGECGDAAELLGECGTASRARYIGGAVEADILFDVSLLEVFADGGSYASTTVVFPTTPYDTITGEGCEFEVAPLE